MLSLVGMTDGEITTLRRDRRFVSALLVRAPMAGTIIARHGAAGERVQASAPLVTIARLDPIWVNLQIPIGRVAAIESQASGSRCRVLGLRDDDSGSGAPVDFGDAIGDRRGRGQSR